MSQLLVNGRHAFWGELRLPRVGAWDGDFGLPRDGDTEVEGPVTVQMGEVTWQGTVWRSGENAGALYVRAVGGAGGLSNAAPARAYQSVPARLVINDLLGEVGEVLSPTSDAGLLGMTLPKWNRSAQSAGLALANLVRHLGAIWRVQRDGTVWIGTEAWRESALQEYRYLQQAPNAGVVDILVRDPFIFPGEMFLDRRVSVVTHRVESRAIVTRILWEEEGDKTDRLKDGALAFIRSAFPQIDYLAGYWCRVVAQNADGALELLPDDPRIPGLSKVPIRYGVPGASARVNAGARVLLEFAGADPSKPIATAWESATPTEIVLGVGANEPAALATALRTELNAIWSKLTALGLHTHAHGDSAGTTSTPSSGAVAADPQTIASSVVKVRT